ncbi:hypothetical protein NVP1216O_30 [Vibrio phage 1.216.O._10N.222.55.C12]|nr:hypothetical protein NVP1216O_30 [Vibrio phage 1.216.O._10N.222.55.C12]
MASKNFTGYLRSSLGSYAGHDLWRFTHISNTGEVVAGSAEEFRVAESGLYDIDIEYGNVVIESKSSLSRRWYNHGSTVVNSETVVTTLPGLLNAMVPVSDEVLLQMQALLADAETAKDESEASALRSEAAAQESINNSILMTESEARAIQSLNENKYAASGMVHMGKHYNAGGENESINEGLWTTISESQRNQVRLGRRTTDVAVGTSKTNFAVTHIAGAITNITFGDSGERVTFKFPEAPTGTVIYDSTGDARGSGEANLDLSKEIDPKYGDVAADTNEAVARAFEGSVKNGDFRTNDTTDWAGTLTVANQIGTVSTGSSGSNKQAYSSLMTLEANTDYVVEFSVHAVTTGFTTAQGYISTSTSSADQLTQISGFENTQNKATFNAGDETEVRFVIYAIGNSGDGYIEFSNVRVYKATEEVVTHPVDLAMLEYYEEELTGRQEIFECIQSPSTTFGNTDVPTVLSTRPLSYFQQYDGQFADPAAQNDQYRCVVWDDLTDEQKRKVAAYMGEKLFVGENGHIVNGRLRARTIRGLGDGDWADGQNVGISSASTRYLGSKIGSSPANFLKAQGANDTTLPFDSSTVNLYESSDQGYINNQGIYKASIGTLPAYKGRCFAYVVATVPRANQGAYHPDLNPWGCATWWTADGVSSSTRTWDSTDFKPVTVRECFTYYTSASGHGRVAGDRGNIGRGSGHPDGIFYDGIEAGGLNGVIDWRLSAYPVDTKEDGSKGFSKVVDGSYRGLERLVETQAGAVTAYNSRSTNRFTIKGIPLLDALGTDEVKLYDTPLKMYYVGPGGSVIEFSVVKVNGRYDNEGVDVTYAENDSRHGPIVVGGYFAAADYLNLSVSGEFKNEVVFADPVHLLANQDYKNGWLGVWGGIPAGNAMHCVRKVIGSEQLVAVQSVSPYTDYTTVTGVNETILNETPIPLLADVIYSFPMKNFAKQAKPSTNKPVLNGSEGLLGIFVTQSFDKSVLTESVANVILTSDASGIVTEQSNAVKYLIDDMIERIKTLPNDMVTPANDSQAVKIAVYQVSENGQMYLGFIANTMTHNGTDWGELEEMQVPSDSMTDGTFIDANGTTQTYHSRITSIPHGWSQNKARFGTVTGGVDQ